MNPTNGQAEPIPVKEELSNTNQPLQPQSVIPPQILPQNNNHLESEPLQRDRVKEEKKPNGDKAVKIATEVMRNSSESKKELNWTDRFVNFLSKNVIDVAKGNYDYQEVNDQSRKKINELTGNPQLSLLLAAIAPKLNAFVLTKIESTLNEKDKFYKEGLKTTLKEQGKLIEESLNATLLKIMANLAQSTKMHFDGQVTFPNMISYLLKIVEGHLGDLHLKINEAENIVDKDLREKKLKEIFSPIKNEILHVILPNRVDDIVLPDGIIMGKIKSHIYQALESSIPDLILKFYHTIMDPTVKNRKEDEEALKKFPGGEFLSTFAEMISKKIPEKLPELLGDNLTPVLEEWSHHLLNHANPHDQKSLSRWLSQNFKELVTSENPQIEILLQFLEFYINPIIKHIFLKMAQRSTEAIPEDEDNILATISKHLLSTTTEFFDKNHENINLAIKKFKATIDPEERAHNEKEVLSLFQPLTDEIFITLGLNEPESLPIPVFLKNVIINIAKEQIPQRLIKLYQDLVPLEVFEDIEHPQKQKFAEFAEVIVSNVVPTILEKAQTLAPDMTKSILKQRENLPLNENDLETLLSSFIELMMTDASAKQLGNYLKNQVTHLFTNILTKLATLNLPLELNIADQPVDLLTNLVTQIISLGKKHFAKMDPEVMLRLTQLKNLAPEHQEKERDFLMRQFIPLGDELMKMAGFTSSLSLPGPSELKKTIYDLLRDRLIPGFLLSTFQGLSQAYVDRLGILQEFLPEEIEPLKNTSHFLAEKLIHSLRETLNEEKQSELLIAFFNENFLTEAQLTPELQIWLAEELGNLLHKRSPTIEEGIGYITNYLENILFNALGSLAQQYSRMHAAEALQPETQDVMRLVVLQLIYLLNDGVESLDRKLFEDIKKLNDLSEEDKVKKLNELSIKLKPVILKVLHGLGLKDSKDLAIPEYLKEPLWKKLTESLIPEQLINILAKASSLIPETPPMEDLQELINRKRLSTTLHTIVDNIVPSVQTAIKNNLSLEGDEEHRTYTQRIYAFMERLVPGAIEKETVFQLLQDIANGKDVGIKNLLNKFPLIIQQFIEPFLLNMAAINGEKGDVLVKIVHNLIGIISENFENRLENYEADLLDYEFLDSEQQGERLEEVFGLLIDSIFEAGGLDPFQVPESLRKPLLAQVFKFYQMLKAPINIEQSYRLKLHELMGVEISQLQEDLANYTQKLEVDFNPLENAIAWISDKINRQIKKTLLEKGEDIIQWVDSILPVQKLNEHDREWLKAVLNQVIGGRDPAIENLWNYTEGVFRSALMKIFVDIANQSSDIETPKHLLITNMINRLVSLFDVNLEGSQERIQEILQSSLSQEEKRVQMRHIFHPIAAEFLAMAGPDALEALPIPEALKNNLEIELREKLLPDLLSSFFTDINKWNIHTERDRDHLFRLFANENPASAAKVIARFTMDILPVVLTNPEKKVSEKLFKVISEQILKQPEERAKALHTYLENNREEAIGLIRDNLNLLLDEKNFDFMDKVSPGVEEFIEVAIIRSMSTIFSKINHVQSPDFMVDMGLKMIQIANAHFQEINRIKEEEGEKLVYKVDESTMLNKYGSAGNEDPLSPSLHPAISRDTTLSEEEKNQQIMNHFFIPITEEFLKLAGISKPEDLPVPAPLAEKVFSLIKTDLCPLIFNEVLESIDVDKLMLSVMELINNGIKNPASPEELHIDLATDLKQKEMNKACGELFFNMIKLIPNTAIKAFFLSDKVRNLSAEAIGQTVRMQLMKMDMLSLINKGLLSGMPTLNKLITVDERGNLVVPEDLSFQFPRTHAERKAETKAKAHQKKMVRKELVRELTKTLRNQIVFRINEFFRKKWSAFQTKFDQWIFTHFGESGKRIKEVLDKIFHMIVFNILGVVFQVLAYPFIQLLGFIMHFHLKRKSKQISKTLHLDIHKNLVFKLMEEIVNTLNEKSEGFSKSKRKMRNKKESPHLNVKEEVSI